MEAPGSRQNRFSRSTSKFEVIFVFLGLYHRIARTKWENIEDKLTDLEYTNSNVFKTINRISSSSVTVSKGVF